jgi:hypothetical protein
MLPPYPKSSESSKRNHVVPFRRRPRRERIVMFRIHASSLKEAVMNAYLDRLIGARDVADLFSEYGLSDD